MIRLHHCLLLVHHYPLFLLHHPLPIPSGCNPLACPLHGWVQPVHIRWRYLPGKTIIVGHVVFQWVHDGVLFGQMHLLLCHVVPAQASKHLIVHRQVSKLGLCDKLRSDLNARKKRRKSPHVIYQRWKKFSGYFLKIQFERLPIFSGFFFLWDSVC